jgi:hypothetical protein
MTLESASQQTKKNHKDVINKTGPFVDKQIIILTNSGLKKTRLNVYYLRLHSKFI